MATKSPGLAADPYQETAARPSGDGREAAHYGKTHRLENSFATAEAGVSGPVVKVVRRDGVIYAGPFESLTIEEIDRRLAEVAP